MNAEQYLYKAEFLLKRKEYEKLVEALEKAILLANEHGDFVTLIKAHCFFGEFLFMQGEYAKAKEYLLFILENNDKTETCDDLLNEEIFQSDLLISLIERYKE